jgi:type I restriction enzyme, R subunit
MSPTTPEALARLQIDAALARAGWSVQDAATANLRAACGVAVREFPLKSGHGEADYLLFANAKAVGVVEAKKLGETLTGVEIQSARYGAGLPDHLKAPVRPLPFLYESTGAETRFTNRLDPAPRPRALIQMATGSGKTYTAISSIYRLIKFADARRVLFLVDRANLGRQTLNT